MIEVFLKLGGAILAIIGLASGDPSYILYGALMIFISYQE